MFVNHRGYNNVTGTLPQAIKRTGMFGLSRVSARNRERNGRPKTATPSLIMGMKAALKTRDDLVQVEILMREQGLRTETRLKLILARARLKWQLLAVEMREQLRVPPS